MDQVVVPQGQKLKQVIASWTSDLHLVYTLPYSPFTSKLLKEKFEAKLHDTQPAFVDQWTRQYGSASDVKWYVSAACMRGVCLLRYARECVHVHATPQVCATWRVYAPCICGCRACRRVCARARRACESPRTERV